MRRNGRRSGWSRRKDEDIVSCQPRPFLAGGQIYACVVISSSYIFAHMAQLWTVWFLVVCAFVLSVLPSDAKEECCVKVDTSTKQLVDAKGIVFIAPCTRSRRVSLDSTCVQTAIHSVSLPRAGTSIPWSKRSKLTAAAYRTTHIPYMFPTYFLFRYTRASPITLAIRLSTLNSR